MLFLVLLCLCLDSSKFITTQEVSDRQLYMYNNALRFFFPSLGCCTCFPCDNQGDYSESGSQNPLLLDPTPSSLRPNGRNVYPNSQLLDLLLRMASGRNGNNRFNQLDPNFLPPQSLVDSSLLSGLLQRPSYERKPLLQPNQVDELQRPTTNSDSSKQKAFSLTRAQRQATRLRNILRLWQFQYLMSQLGSRSLSNTLRQLSSIRANFSASESQTNPSSTRVSWLFSGQPQINETNDSSPGVEPIINQTPLLRFPEIFNENTGSKSFQIKNESDAKENNKNNFSSNAKMSEPMTNEFNVSTTNPVAQLLLSMDSQAQNKSVTNSSQENDEETSDVTLLLDYLGAYLEQLHQMNISKIQNFTNAKGFPNVTSELNNNLGLSFPATTVNDQDSAFQSVLNNGDGTLVSSSLNEQKLNGEQTLASTGTGASVVTGNASSTPASGNRRKNKNRGRGQQNKQNQQNQRRSNSGGNKNRKNPKKALTKTTSA